jgi:molybdenum cofactor cytidylyltransferase
VAQSIAILLAAGESKRMGQLKALLPWQGRTMLEHQVNSLHDGGLDKIIVVLGHGKGKLLPLLTDPEYVTPIYNPNYLSGKTSSIKRGLSQIDATNTDYVMLLNVDQPRSSNIIRTLAQYHETSRSLITIPSFNGKGGHPIIFDLSLLPDLLKIEESTQGIKSVVTQNQDRLQKVDVCYEEVLWDLNTPEEYHKISAKFEAY